MFEQLPFNQTALDRAVICRESIIFHRHRTRSFCGIAPLMKPQDIWRNFRRLGLGRLPHAGLPGAVAGTSRRYQHWRRIEQATMSYGYSLSVSLLQLAQIYTTFANDGRIVSTTIFSQEGRVVESRQIYSARVTRQVRTMMQSVISADGTAPQDAAPGYSVVGKTGTAYQWTKKGYDHRQYRASPVGIIPASRPRVVIAVSIEHPHVGSHFGGAVAGHPFAQIAIDTMHLLNVSRDEPVDAVGTTAKDPTTWPPTCPERRHCNHD